MVRICAIGDPHGAIEKIKKISFGHTDLILITGDLGKADLARQRFFENQKRIQEGLEEMDENDKKFQKDVHFQIHDSTILVLKYLSKIAPTFSIQGNVGIFSISEVRDAKKKFNINLPSTKKEIDKIKNFKLVKNNLRNIAGLRIGFLEYFTDTSWVKEFKPKDYKNSFKRAKKQTAKAIKVLKRFGKLDILVCHQPPYGVLDKVNFPGVPKSWKGKHAGSKAVLDYIKKHPPRLVLCGHIHEAKGEAKIGKTKIYNLGCCGDYKILDIV
jgi:Icc-related predicted phosphoesterase